MNTDPERLFFQPTPEQRGGEVPDERRPLQLLQPQLPAALHPAARDQQLGALQLRAPDRGAQPVDERLPAGAAGALHPHHALHRPHRPPHLAV